MAGRHLPAQPWLHALGPVWERLAALPIPEAARFQRIELGARHCQRPRVRSTGVDDGGNAGTESAGAGSVMPPAGERCALPDGDGRAPRRCNPARRQCNRGIGRRARR